MRRAWCARGARPRGRVRQAARRARGQIGGAGMDPVPAGLLQHGQRASAQVLRIPGGKPWSKRAASRPAGVQGVGRVGHRTVAGPRGRSARPAVGARRTGSRCPRDRTATSDPSRRRRCIPAHGRRRERAECLGGVEEERCPGGDERGGSITRPETQETCEQAIRRVEADAAAGDLGQTATTRTVDAVAAAGPAQRREQAGMLFVAGDDLVAGAQVEPGRMVLTPSVVEPVSATSSTSAPSTRA